MVGKVRQRGEHRGREHIRRVSRTGPRQRWGVRGPCGSAGCHVPVIRGTQLRHRRPGAVRRLHLFTAPDRSIAPTNPWAESHYQRRIEFRLLARHTGDAGYSSGPWGAGLSLGVPATAQPPAGDQGGRLHRTHGPVDRHCDLSGRKPGHFSEPDLSPKPRQLPRHQRLGRPAPLRSRHHCAGHRAHRPVPVYPLRSGHPGLGRDGGRRPGKRSFTRPDRPDQLGN